MKIHSIFLLLILACSINVIEAHSGNEVRNRKKSTQEDTRQRMVKFSTLIVDYDVENSCDLNCVVKGAGYCCTFSSIGGITVLQYKQWRRILKASLIKI